MLEIEPDNVKHLPGGNGFEDIKERDHGEEVWYHVVESESLKRDQER